MKKIILFSLLVPLFLVILASTAAAQSAGSSFSFGQFNGSSSVNFGPSSASVVIRLSSPYHLSPPRGAWAYSTGRPGWSTGSRYTRGSRGIVDARDYYAGGLGRSTAYRASGVFTGIFGQDVYFVSR